MSFRVGLLSSLFVLSATVAAHAGTIGIDIPDSTEKVLIDLPEGWVEAFTDEKASGTRRTIIHEYVPDGQTVSDWEEMITVVLTRPEKAPDDEQYINNAKAMTIKFYRDLCIGHPERMMVPTETRNGYPTALFYMSCIVRPEAKAARPEQVKNLESLIGISMTSQGGWSLQVQRAWHTNKLEDDGKAGLKGPDKKRDEFEAAQAAMMKFAQEEVVICNTADSAKPCTLPVTH